MFTKFTSITVVLSLVVLCSSKTASGEEVPRRDEERIVYEYGFEDGWNDWEGAFPWELSDEDSHNGDFSAHCEIRPNLVSSLITPPLEIPDERWHTYFEFWVRADTRMYDSDGDNMLDDYFRLQISVDNGGWQDVIYDYGRDEEWQMNWIYYGPGVWFRNDMPEWRVMLNLTQFADQEVRLMWLFITDNVMDGDQGTGLWIDDFRLIASDTRENDVGMEWLHVNYPTSRGVDITGQVKAGNYGIADQNRVIKFIRIDDERAIPIVPWGAIESQSFELFDFRLDEDYIPYTGVATVNAYTDLRGEDENLDNDTAYVNVLIYPEDMWKLGYDDRRCPDVMVFDHNGPAVLFTPGEDGIEGEFDLYAVEALWSDEQQDEEVTTTLTISENDRNRPGDEIYSAEIVVSPDDLSPRFHYIDLSEVDDLKNLEQDFWVSFMIEREDQLPQILGRIPDEDDRYWGEDHYFTFDGENATEMDVDFQIHAILTGGELDEINLVVQSNLHFGEVGIDGSETLSLVILGASTEPVTIEDFDIDSDVFSVEPDVDLPIELSVGETVIFNVTFAPEEEGEFEAELSFTCDDESPPSVNITGTGSIFPEVELIPDELDFGEIEVERFSERAFIVFNAGMADLIVSDMRINGDYFEVEFDGEFSVEPDEEIDVFVIFTPLESGRFEGELVVTCNDPGNRNPSISLTGFGVGPPIVDRPIDDIVVDEDFEPFAVADLDTVFTDREGDEMTFTAESDDENLGADVDDENVLWISTTENWSGDATVTITADDHVGDERIEHRGHPRPISDFYTVAGFNGLSQVQLPKVENDIPRRDYTTDHSFLVTVLPVNDAPSRFSLLLPPDGFYVDRQNYDVTFVWDESQDVDGDTVGYYMNFHIIDEDVDTLITVERIRISELTLQMDDVLTEAGFFGGAIDSSVTVVWWVEANDGELTTESDQCWTLEVDEPTSVRGVEVGLPSEFSLEDAYPNPFNSTTNISYSVPFTSRITIRIHDLTGGLLLTLCDEVKQTGRFTTTWNGRSIPAGLYLVRMESSDFQAVRKLVLVK